MTSSVMGRAADLNKCIMGYQPIHLYITLRVAFGALWVQISIIWSQSVHYKDLWIEISQI